MSFESNPAIHAFVVSFQKDICIAQVWVARQETGFELRHADDRRKGAADLSEVAVADLRRFARETEKGAFRPLKSAPDLRTGWRCVVAGQRELEEALSVLYPGAIADWFTEGREGRSATDYRAFTGRQTGMYRLTQKLDDALVGEVVRSVCDKRFCLKRRLWDAPGLEVDSEANKSMIPCLEPCALLLEFSRTTMRMEQIDKIEAQLTRGDVETLAAALRRAQADEPGETREADFSSPDNPRRIQLTLQRVEAMLKANEGDESED